MLITYSRIVILLGLISVDLLPADVHHVRNFLQRHCPYTID